MQYFEAILGKKVDESDPNQLDWTGSVVSRAATTDTTHAAESSISRIFWHGEWPELSFLLVTCLKVHLQK